MSTVTINTQPVTPGTAAWFEGLRYAFRERFGLDLIVTSGLRTRAEQQRLYNAWRAGTGNYAVPPATSRHETGRALDLRDSGADPGVTIAGTTRSTWLRDHSPQYGFVPAGFAFTHVEPWHYELAGTHDPHTSPTTPATKKRGRPHAHQHPRPSRQTPRRHLLHPRRTRVLPRWHDHRAPQSRHRTSRRAR